jgi:hypothetical protein
VSAREGGAGWLGRPKVEVQLWLAVVAKWEGKGEWAGWGGWRGGSMAGPNPKPGQSSKRNSFQISIDFRI